MAFNKKRSLGSPGPNRRLQFTDKIVITRKLVIQETDKHVEVDTIGKVMLDFSQAQELRNALTNWMTNRRLRAQKETNDK